MLASMTEILASSFSFGLMGVLNVGQISPLAAVVVSRVEFEQAVAAAKAVQTNRVESGRLIFMQNFSQFDFG